MCVCMCECVCVCVCVVCMDAFARNTFSHGILQVLKVWKKCHEVNMSGAECFIHNLTTCTIHSGKELGLAGSWNTLRSLDISSD